MTILGIDYGERKVGLAVAEGPLAAPLSVIRYKDKESLFANLKAVIKKENIDKIVVGISEGESAQKAQEFGAKLSKQTDIQIEYQDETLSTEEVIRMSLEAKIKRKKRHEMEDAYAATLILQNYLDR